MANLERVMQQLHDSEINAGVETFYDAGMRVWLGDTINGIQAETSIKPTGPPMARRRHCCELAACGSVAAISQSNYAKASAPPPWARRSHRGLRHHV